jgi:hypothetical protein
LCFDKVLDRLFCAVRLGYLENACLVMTVDVLTTAISEVLATITDADIEGWVKHCGYQL